MLPLSRAFFQDREPEFFDRERARLVSVKKRKVYDWLRRIWTFQKSRVFCLFVSLVGWLRAERI